MSFRIDIISNRGRSPQTLLRQSWREGKRVRHKTVANLTKLPPHIVDGMRAVLKGGGVFERIGDAVSIRRSLPQNAIPSAPAATAMVGGSMRGETSQNAMTAERRADGGRAKMKGTCPSRSRFGHARPSPSRLQGISTNTGGTNASSSSRVQNH